MGNFPSSKFLCVADSITRKYDALASIIFGYIWSKSQLRNGYCNVSYKNIATDLGLSRKTVQRKVAILIEANLINDISTARFNNPGVTRRYVCNESMIRSLDSEDLKSLVKNSEDLKTLLKNDSEDLQSISGDIESIGRDSQSTSEDFESKSRDFKSHKVYKEVYKENIEELNKDIDIDIESHTYVTCDKSVTPSTPISSSADPKKEKEPKTWAEAMEKRFGEEITNNVCLELIDKLNHSKKKVSDYPYILQRLPSQQHQITDYEVSFILELMDIA